MKKNFSFRFLFELAAVVSIVFSIVWEIDVRIKKNEWDQKVVTLEALDVDPSVGEFDFNKNYKLNELIEYFNNNPSHYKDFINVFNYYNKLGVGLKTGIYHIEILDQSKGGLIIRRYERFQSYINYRRIKTPLAWKEYEYLVNKIIDYKKEQIQYD